MKTALAFLVGVCFGIATISIAKCNSPFCTKAASDCGCKDCETEKKCKPKCFCASPLQ